MAIGNHYKVEQSQHIVGLATIYCGSASEFDDLAVTSLPIHEQGTLAGLAVGDIR